LAGLKQLTRPIITIFLIGITVLGLLNVYGDASEVVALAQKVACRGTPCATRTTRIERTPFAHEYDIAASIPSGKQLTTVSSTVKCTRMYILIGDWTCSENGKQGAESTSRSSR
jgi:hypothetical protein